MTSEEEPKVVRKNDDAPIIEEWVSDSEEENVSQTKTEKKTVKPSIAKIEFVKPKQQEKTARKTVKHKQNTHSPRGNQRNWNNMMSQKLGSNFEMFNKACYVCGSFDHLQVDCNYHQKQFQNQRMVKTVWNNAQRIQLSDGLGPQKKLIFLSNVQDYEEIDGGYVAFEGNPNEREKHRTGQSNSHDDESKPSSDDGKKVDKDPRKDSECNDQEKEDNVNSTNNVNAASTNDVIKEEVYVCQPPGFKDLDFPDKVYKVEKALYGLNQAPRAWYEILSTYLLDNEFQRGKIDKTLFIKRYKGDILLDQVYVDDIIFG
ncbi:ribonuclease H-like domain-containing protein [Tanacetum coccineum]